MIIATRLPWVLIAPGEMFDNMLQLMRFSVYFKGITLFSYKNNDISGTHAKGLVGMLPQKIFEKKMQLGAFCLMFLCILAYSMCSLAVSTQDSPAVEPRSNPGSGKILMSENLRLYTTSPVVMC